MVQDQFCLKYTHGTIDQGNNRWHCDCHSQHSQSTLSHHWSVRIGHTTGYHCVIRVHALCGCGCEHIQNSQHTHGMVRGSVIAVLSCVCVHDIALWILDVACVWHSNGWCANGCAVQIPHLETVSTLQNFFTAVFFGVIYPL